MHLSGPHSSTIYLQLDGAVTLSSHDEGALIRVLRDTGYPHDLRLSPHRDVTLKAGRIFTPVLSPDTAVELIARESGAAEVLALCANCFAELWRQPAHWPLNAEQLLAAERDFWAQVDAHACPRCHAAASRPH